jgi:hypothetical protein
MVSLKISPYGNFDFDFGLDHPVHGGYGWGDMALQVGGVSDETVIYMRDSNQCVIALQITNPSSRQRGRLTRRRKKAIVKERNLKSDYLPQRGPNTKTNWPTDRRSQNQLQTLNYNRVTLFLGDINMRTWRSRLGESQMRQWYLIMAPALLRTVSDSTVNYRPVL